MKSDLILRWANLGQRVIDELRRVSEERDELIAMLEKCEKLLWTLPHNVNCEVHALHLLDPTCDCGLCETIGDARALLVSLKGGKPESEP